MPDVKLIALDLDGTLLDSGKRLSPENAAALQKAAQEGIYVVPTTGRFYAAMPQVVRDLPYVRYVIDVNGAGIRDVQTGERVFRADIPWDEAVRIMDHLETLPVIYDCFQDDEAFMSRRMYEQIPLFAPDEHYYKMLTELRKPVDDLRDFLRARKRGIQKTQFFFRDMDLRRRLLTELPARFSAYTVSSSVVNNIEITHKKANKGDALRFLCEYLGFSAKNSVAFGDDLNDIPMLKAAGVGVAMQNARPEALSAADKVTESNDDDGVAKELRRLLWRDRP